ncbi:MAG: hypothetical protein WEC59_13175 [Salibacteraceae bacterium]
MSYRSFLIIAVLALFTPGCETDIEIIAPKKDVTVIYGLLESNKTRHFIRINKAFVGEDSAKVLAAEPGINEYSDSELSAFVREKNLDGTETGAYWELNPTYVKSKEDGTFFSDSNKVYYFDADLAIDKEYELVCNIDVEGEDLKEVKASTRVIGSNQGAVTLLKPRFIGTTSQGGDRAEVDFISQGEYSNALEVEWSNTSGGASYTSYYRFYYTDVNKSTGERTRDSLTFSVGTERVTEGQTGTVSFQINPEEFFIQVDRNVEDYDFANADFERIASDTLQFFLEVADNTLATYIEVNQPATEVVQEQPEYTNVTNGIGIFASRFITSTKNFENPENSGRVFRKATIEELLYSTSVDEGSYNTVQKGFIVPGRCNQTTQTCR